MAKNMSSTTQDLKTMLADRPAIARIAVSYTSDVLRTLRGRAGELAKVVIPPLLTVALLLGEEESVR